MGKGDAYIAYFRVSTQKQGQHGLGMDAQVAAVNAYTGGKVLRSYNEVESGKRSDRPELMKALADCKRSKAVLVIAKLDRLARNVHFLSGLMESGVEFVCCDMPQANRLTLHIMAAVAEDEAARISARTKAALAAYKARGGKLGGYRENAYKFTGGWSLDARTAGVARRKELAREAYADIKPLLAGMVGSLTAKAESLNAMGYRTRRGKEWNAVQVGRVLRYA